MSARAPDPAASPPFDSELSGAETAVLRDGHATSATAQRRLPLSGVRVDFGVREPQGLAQRPGVGDFGSGAVSDVVANHEHLISEPDLRPVQIVESNLQRLGLDGIGPKHMRRLHVTPRFDDSLSGLRLPQIGLVHLDHEAGGATDHDDTREARQPFRFGEFFSGVIRCGYDTGSSWWGGPRSACGDENEAYAPRKNRGDLRAAFRPGQLPRALCGRVRDQPPREAPCVRPATGLARRPPRGDRADRSSQPTAMDGDGFPVLVHQSRPAVSASASASVNPYADATKQNSSQIHSRATVSIPLPVAMNSLSSALNSSVAA